MQNNNLNKNILNRKLITLTAIGEVLKKEVEAKVKYLESEGQDYEPSEDDFEEVDQEMLMFVDEIVTFIRAKEETVIFTKTGLSFTVKDTIEEINNKLNN